MAPPAALSAAITEAEYRAMRSKPAMPAGPPPTGPLDPESCPPPDPSRTGAPPSLSAGRHTGSRDRDPGRYRLLGEHGRGGIGKVSRVHDVELGRDIAIKQLLSRTPVNEARFLREALITARLEHPGIVPVYEAGRWPDGTPFYAMKLVSGRSLRDLLAERETIDERISLLHHVIAVADAMAYAHGRNIIHRDLKPSNVIIGDFGETVVIDWGLAKNLSANEEPPLPGAPGRPSSAAESDGLTSAGTVLGTPAYMPPEQRRGELVDQRADVYAIGAMLWELCSLDRLPPGQAGQRSRALHRNGIDADLIAIITKAVELDPGRRYADAGALAADLKAFKAGARITARHYSLWALARHGIRRYRTLAISLAAVLCILVVGSIAYVRSITAERDRADLSESQARRARETAETSLDELTLKHAQLLLASDPSAALEALASYHGSDGTAANQLRAQAVGRGVSTIRVRPHTDRAIWVEGMRDGSVASLSVDGTIARTMPDGTSSVVARNVGHMGKSTYSAARHLLAYVCDPSDLCIYDFDDRSGRAMTKVLEDAHAVGLAFSADGSLLAAMSSNAILRVFDMANPGHPVLRFTREIVDGNDVCCFLRNDVVIAASAYRIDFVHLGTGRTDSFPVQDNSFWALEPEGGLFAVATIYGEILLINGSTRVIDRRISACPGPVAALQFIVRRRSVAYACRAGTVGTWDVQSGAITQRYQFQGHADRLKVSSAGDYIIVAGGNGIVAAIDLTTDLVTTYMGHEFRLTGLAAPSADHASIVSADIRGALRVWPLPPRYARVVGTLNTQLHTSMFDRQSGRVIAASLLPVLTTYSQAEGLRTVGPHENYNIFLESSGGRNVFATYGLNDLVEIWSIPDVKRSRIFATGQGSVSQLSFIGDSDEFVTSGRDGRLIRWDASPVAPVARVLARVDQPIDHFVTVNNSAEIVFSSADGALWRVGEDGTTALLKAKGSRVMRLLALPGTRTIYAGHADGEVIAIDARSWQVAPLVHATGQVQDISATPDGRLMAVATNADVVYLGEKHLGASAMSWRRLRLRSRHQAFASDGMLVVLSPDGEVWMYSAQHERWLCVATGTADLRWITIAPDDRAAMVVDSEGRLLWLDLEAARRGMNAR